MGDSHYRSNIIAKDGTQKIVGFNIASVNSINATNLIANTLASTPKVHGTTQVIAGNHIRIGTNKYIFVTTKTTAATLEAEATAYAKASLAATAIAGSIALGPGAIWYFSNGSTATKVGTV